MSIMAFDLGSTTAWALSNFDCDKALMWDSHTATGARPEKLEELQQWIKSSLATERPTFVVYERPFARGLAATRMLWGLAGILEAEAIHASCGVVDVDNATIKKYATGNGNADKDAMIEAAVQWVGAQSYVPFNEHEADAVCLLKYTMEKAEITNG